MQRKSILTSLAVAAVAAASVASTAQAASQGYVTVQQCTGFAGTVTYHPGLKNKAVAMTETITGTLSGCSGQNGAQAGTGTFTATLSSAAASRTANNESGTFVINWPAASGLNPTVGTMSTLGPNAAQYSAYGSDSAGAYTGAAFSTGWIVASQTLGGPNHNKVISESIVNTLPLQIKQNLG